MGAAEAGKEFDPGLTSSTVLISNGKILNILLKLQGDSPYSYTLHAVTTGTVKIK
ncbi:MAG: hypothetical protein P0116_13100 [Candidatus Nitrosocosmicus sp.]|nr:hypothetical protein [Candidatus Nitrosocosmicus sp.]